MRFRSSLITLCVVLGAVAALLWGPPRLIDIITSIMQFGDLEQLIDQLQDEWPWTVTAVLLLMIVEAFLPIIPLAPVVGLNVVLFGPWVGLLISFIGAMLGAAVCFVSARYLGRDRVSRWIDEKYLTRVASIAETHGFKIMVIARYVPPINTFISLLAGLTPVSFRTFMAATAVGLFPWIVVFTVFSSNLLAAKTYITWAAIIATPLGLLYLIRWFRRHSMTLFASDPPVE